MLVEFVGFAIFIAGGLCIVAVEVIFRPKFIIDVAMWSSYLFVTCMVVYFVDSRGEPPLPFALVSALGSTALALIGVGSNWLGRKIRQNSVNEITQFDRKKRKPGQFY